MADKSHKWPENVPGKYYVDEQCIDCDLCRETAPAFFARNDKGSYTYLQAQPTNAADTELCEEAVRNCPVEAIGNDGE
jgi:ferredoxin